MTTNNHLNKFTEIDSKTKSDIRQIADDLLEAENLDLDNTEYLAKALFILGRYKESVRQFERIIELKGNDRDVLKNIGINYFYLKDYDNALKYFNIILEDNPDDESVLTYKMLCHEFLNEYADAVGCGERIIRKNENNVQVIGRLIDYHYILKNYDECLRHINCIRYTDHYKKALILFESGRYDECIEVTGKIRTVESYHLAAKACLKLKNTFKAVKYLYKAYEMDYNVDTLLEISEIYFKDKDYIKATHFLKEALLHDETNTKALIGLACAYYKSAKWEESAEYARRALEVSKKHPKAYIVLAEAQFQMDNANITNAMATIEEAISENPESADLWAEKGNLSFEDDPYTFRISYEKAIELNPDDSKLYLRYINLLLMYDDIETAKIMYNQLLLVNPLYEKSFDELKDPWSFTYTPY